MPFLQIHPKLSLYYQDYPPASQIGKPGFPNPEPVLLLHGLGASSESWALQIPALTDSGFRVIAPDVRGFGKSTHPGGNTNVAEMAGDIAHLLVATQSAPANVVGISMGGALALQLALDHPHLVKRLVLVNTFAGLRPKNPGIWLYFLLRYLVAQIIGVRAQGKIVAKRIFPHPDQEPYRQLLVEQIS